MNEPLEEVEIEMIEEIEKESLVEKEDFDVKEAIFDLGVEPEEEEVE